MAYKNLGLLTILSGSMKYHIFGNDDKKKTNASLCQVLSGIAKLLFFSQKHKPKTLYLCKILKQSIMKAASDCRKYYFKINLSCSYMDLLPSWF